MGHTILVVVVSYLNFLYFEVKRREEAAIILFSLLAMIEVQKRLQNWHRIAA